MQLNLKNILKKTVSDGLNGDLLLSAFSQLQKVDSDISNPTSRYLETF